MKRYPTAIAVLVAGCVPNAHVSSIPYREIADNIQEYSGRPVVVEGIWERFSEYSLLHDIERSGLPKAWVQADSVLTKEEEKSLFRAYERIAVWEEKKPVVRLRVKLRGVFRYRADAKMYEGFGHLGQYKAELKISEIVEMREEPNQPSQPTPPSGVAEP